MNRRRTQNAYGRKDRTQKIKRKTVLGANHEEQEKKVPSSARNYYSHFTPALLESNPGGCSGDLRDVANTKRFEEQSKERSIVLNRSKPTSKITGPVKNRKKRRPNETLRARQEKQKKEATTERNALSWPKGEPSPIPPQGDSAVGGGGRCLTPRTRNAADRGGRWMRVNEWKKMRRRRRRRPF
ncbi:unnamed protein product [Musa acuminata var. zebrina]